jgi:hypothetical protein
MSRRVNSAIAPKTLHVERAMVGLCGRLVSDEYDSSEKSRVKIRTDHKPV